MPAVEDIFHRTYSKGARLLINSGPPVSVPTPITETYINAMRVVAGVKSIKGPKLGRDKVDMNELDQAPAGLSSGDPLGTEDLTKLPLQTQEMYFNKVKAPGDKDVGPVVTSLNLTHQQYGVLHNLYTRDLPFVWLINLRVKPITTGAVTPVTNSRCFFIGFGFISELSEDIQPSALITVACSIQPMFGVGYLSACKSLTDLTRNFANYIPNPTC